MAWNRLERPTEPILACGAERENTWRETASPFFFPVLAALDREELRGSENDFSLGNSTLMTRLVRGPFILDLDIWSPAWSLSSATCQRLERLADKTLNFYMKTRTETEWTLVQTLPQVSWAGR